MTFVVYTSHNVDMIIDEWSELAQRIGQRFSSRPSYALNWFLSVGRGELAVCAVHRAGQLVAVAPLHVRNRFGVRVLRLLGHGLGTLADILATDCDALNELVDGLGARGNSLQLTHIEPGHPFAVAIRESDRWDTEFQIDERCPIVNLGQGCGAASVRSPSTLSKLRAVERGMERAGSPITYQLIRDRSALSDYWWELVALADRADQNSDRTNLWNSPYSPLTRRFLDAEAEAGRLLLVGLRVAGRLKAYGLGIRTGTTGEMWVTHYDPDIRRCRPGQLIMKWFCDHHDALGVKQYDLMIGVNAFKSEWANGGYDVSTLTATPRGLPFRRWLIAASDRGSETARDTVGLKMGAVSSHKLSPASKG